ncbi:fumarylacetoacetate hydrolase family protein [Rhodococcus sp. T2V]|uniref:fumarylacetoacetate hydrolase family protein n=1 Tax=Rhodococcus sp. T2V TaxID=3034164 RepID=UPI0023E25066|nr:fumarylacetoacetate hydrolase family protein [Rhodococcus sp. T2V]MDF3313172.1 fumarylacetoacetate hydrolase family protein [Rhodococcus sp. T2V]
MTVALPGADAPRTGLLKDESIHLLGEGVTLLSLLGDDGERLSSAGDRALRDPHDVVDVADVRVLPPIPNPGAFRDHYAFEQHARAGRRSRGLDLDPIWFEIPIFYYSSPHSMLGPTEDLPMPPGCVRLDYEVEVAAVVGRDCRDVKAADATPYIAGYMVMNDWSARDIQRYEMALNMGPHKGKDFGTTIGPYLVTPDELADAASGKAFDLEMTASVNGVKYTSGNLADIHYSFEEFIEYESRAANLKAGDLIGSGTCATGCILELSTNHGEEQYPWLKVGDIVEIEVGRLGSQRTKIVG